MGVTPRRRLTGKVRLRIRERAIKKAKVRIALHGRKVDDLSEDDLEIIVADEEQKIRKQLVVAPPHRHRRRAWHHLTDPMLNQLLKFTLVSGLLLWLHRRWKWLAGCGGVILAAMYLHGEFLDYVEALPAGSEEAALAGEYIAVAFAIKNIVIFASLLTYFLVEMRASKRRRGHGTDAVDMPRTTEPSRIF